MRRPDADARWFLGLLLVATLLQAATAVARPMASYRALEIGMAPSSLGLVAAAFAIAPVDHRLCLVASGFGGAHGPHRRRLRLRAPLLIRARAAPTLDG